MGIRTRSWRHGRACEQVVELPGGQVYVCGKFTRDRSARCDEHRAKTRPDHRRDERVADRRRAS